MARDRAYDAAYAQLESHGTIMPASLSVQSSSCGALEIMGTVTGVVCDVTLKARVISVE